MDQRTIPAIAFRLWNPKVAAGLGFLFTPAFSAWLHAINWREIGEPERARANMIWVWGIFAYLVFIIGTVLFPLPKTLDAAIGRVLTPLLWLAWYGFEGRTQVQYVKSLGGHYKKNGWMRPLIAAILALGLYFGIGLALVYGIDYATQLRIPATRDPVELSVWIETRIQKKWHEMSTLHDATIQKVDLSRKDETTYTGKVDATIEGKPVRFDLKLIVAGDDAGWELKRSADDPQSK